MKMLLGTLILALLCNSATAEQVLETERYLVHYNAFNSTVIDADAATANNLIRSKYSAMINIAVFIKNPDGSTSAVKSFNSGTVQNLLRQQQPLTFATINEGKAIYYIASFRFADQELMNFSIKVQPDPNQPPITLELSQKFYVD
ncbi:MAG: DUF4426 domain-containing protein [Oceanospirillaceae bacterium]|nr:DUF4426 domain-containing protein [Oceanospirillaceae bacterium]